MIDLKNREQSDDYNPFPRDIFPEDAFPEDIFPSDVFPGGDESNEDDNC